ncbi:MAG TPA: aldehyde dehydrogenase family protein [Thermoleophilaceae bacterium]|nr:aldehyde dehydrogenase family protein [Thermoleophilaceae bacterium]
MSRLSVRKTYKLFVGGAFVRSESGRYDRNQGFNIPRGSRKDVRDAVLAARNSSNKWAARTAYNRGQILYRCAEALESRAADFVSRGGEPGASRVGEPGVSRVGEPGVSRSELDASIDVLVHYAGWTDKLQPVLGGINPVAAPFLSFSLPEPTGVVGIVAPDSPALLGLIAELAPVMAAGNTAVCLLSNEHPLPGLDLAEVLGIADVPGGVVNLLSGRREELAPVLAGHHAVNAVVDASGDPSLGEEIDKLAADSVTRVRHTEPTTGYEEATRDALSRLEAVTELKTAWHPVGA